MTLKQSACLYSYIGCHSPSSLASTVKSNKSTFFSCRTSRFNENFDMLIITNLTVTSPQIDLYFGFKV